MDIVVRPATPADLERLIAELDQQFVFGKGRRISLAQRFPAVYCSQNAGNLFLLEEQGNILACLACKRFEFLCRGDAWRGAMIGAVYTHPQRRGEGLASRLLREVEGALRARDVAYSVLWTDQPAFYARIGWVRADHGLLGQFESHSHPRKPSRDVARRPAQSADFEHIERVRRRWCDCLMPRRSEDYRQLPPPATAVDLLTWGEGTDHAAYALVGNDGAMSILYEMIGDPAGFAALWPEACRGYRRTLINDVSGSASHSWLTANSDLVWHAKPLAMWLPLSARTDLTHVARWHIPYFDRI